MARIFITGSSDGIGQLAAKNLIEQGHQVVLHARNKERANDTLKKVPGAEKVLIADLSDIEQIKQLAEDVNALGTFDAIIHNAGVYNVPAKIICNVNVLAPYLLTCLIKKPKRIIYIGSGMHMQGNANLNNLSNGTSYSDSKLFVLTLSMAVTRKWPNVLSNTVNPGWVPTKMGGSSASDDLAKGAETQAWLAVSDDEKAKVSGYNFYHKKHETFRPESKESNFQDKFLTLCEEMSGVRFH